VSETASQPSQANHHILRDIVSLAKPRLSSVVLFTTGVGIALAPRLVGWPKILGTLMGTCLLVSAANAFNCILEKDSDALMLRTQKRPLATGRLKTSVAWTTGIVWFVISLPLLWWSSNGLTLALGLIAFLTYVGLYTPMKKRTSFALVVGAVPGAMPPLMGWTAVTNQIGVEGLILFGLLFLWQMPHFLALSYFLRDDYKRGGHQVFSVVFGDATTKLVTSLSVIALILLSYIPVILGWADLTYCICVALLGLGFLGWSVVGYTPGDNKPWAKQLFLASLGYLTLVLSVLLARAAPL
jgi:heme o synthase